MRPSFSFVAMLTLATSLLGGCGVVTTVNAPQQLETLPKGSREYVANITFNNGSHYTGSIGFYTDDGWYHPDGEGTLLYPDGARKTGTFRNGHFVRGTDNHEGFTSIGDFDEQGNLTRGTVIYPGGAVQFGSWDHAKEVGRGTIEWPDGRRYQGDWKYVDDDVDLPEGQGHMTWPNGDTYDGAFHNGNPDGKVSGAAAKVSK